MRMLIHEYDDVENYYYNDVGPFNILVNVGLLYRYPGCDPYCLHSDGNLVQYRIYQQTDVNSNCYQPFLLATPKA